MITLKSILPAIFFPKVQVIDTVKLIKATAADLIRQQGKITTTEIKNHLRLQGYRITQREVSVITQIFAKETGLDWICNGFYRTYFLCA